jgi:8-oxo-dGTP diphosphatase
MDHNQEGKNIIQAAGGIVWRIAPDQRQVALVHRPKYDDWTLPKGKLVAGESWREAAKREVEEELQCQVELCELAGSLYYMAGGEPKLVLFWNMRIVEERVFQPNREIDQWIWLEVAQAIEKLSYSTEKSMLRDCWSAGKPERSHWESKNRKKD